MDFEAGSPGRSLWAPLAGAVVASAVLLFVLLVNDAKAELINPEAATPPQVIVPNTANAAPPPATQAPPSAPASSEPASDPESSSDSTGAPQGAPPGDDPNADSPQGDAPVLSLGYRVMDLELSMESLGNVTYNLVHLDEQVNGARDSVQELIANAEVLQNSIKELLDSIQHAAPTPTDPARSDGASPDQSNTAPETSGQTGDPSSGPDAGAPDSGGQGNDGSGSASPSGDGSGGGSGGGGKEPDGDPTQAVD